MDKQQLENIYDLLADATETLLTDIKDGLSDTRAEDTRAALDALSVIENRGWREAFARQQVPAVNITGLAVATDTAHDS